MVILEGVPAGLLVTAEDIQRGLARRRLGFGRGPRMRFEVDEISLVGGVRHGRTLGSPIAIEIANTEWPKWEEEMSPAPGLPSKVLTQPRPGHADLAGMLKYGLDDARDVLERASARETAARVAAGTVAVPASPAPAVVYTQAAPAVVYTQPYPYSYYYAADPYYSPWGFYGPLAVGIGLGFGFHGGYYHGGGFYHGHGRW